MLEQSLLIFVAIIVCHEVSALLVFSDGFGKTLEHPPQTKLVEGARQRHRVRTVLPAVVSSPNVIAEHSEISDSFERPPSLDEDAQLAVPRSASWASFASRQVQEDYKHQAVDILVDEPSNTLGPLRLLEDVQRVSKEQDYANETTVQSTVMNGSDVVRSSDVASSALSLLDGLLDGEHRRSFDPRGPSYAHDRSYDITDRASYDRYQGSNRLPPHHGPPYDRERYSDPNDRMNGAHHDYDAVSTLLDRQEHILDVLTNLEQRIMTRPATRGSLKMQQGFSLGQNDVEPVSKRCGPTSVPITSLLSLKTTPVSELQCIFGAGVAPSEIPLGLFYGAPLRGNLASSPQKFNEDLWGSRLLVSTTCQQETVVIAATLINSVPRFYSKVYIATTPESQDAVRRFPKDLTDTKASLWFDFTINLKQLCLTDGPEPRRRLTEDAYMFAMAFVERVRALFGDDTAKDLLVKTGWDTALPSMKHTEAYNFATGANDLQSIVRSAASLAVTGLDHLRHSTVPSPPLDLANALPPHLPLLRAEESLSQVTAAAPLMHHMLDEVRRVGYNDDTHKDIYLGRTFLETHGQYDLVTWWFAEAYRSKL